MSLYECPYNKSVLCSMEKPKKETSDTVTICVKCRNLRFQHDIRMNGNVECCAANRSSIDYVTGAKSYRLCRDINTSGSCPDYVSKS